MSTTNQYPRPEREEIELLLPWYVAGTLDDHERQRVQDFLEHDPELRSQLALIEEDRTETVFANEALDAPTAGSLSRLMDKIDAEVPGKVTPLAAAADLWKKVDRVIQELQPSAVRWAAVAAAVMIFVQAIALGGLLTGNIGGDNYRTASGDRGAGTTVGTFALVKFTDSATAGQISELLEETGAQIVGGPMPGNVYQVKISDDVLPEAAMERALKNFEKDAGIVSKVWPSG